MAKSFEIIVDESNSGFRLDQFLTNICAYKSRSIAAKFCDSGKVLVNDNKAQKKLKVQSGDVVVYEEALEDSEIVGQDIPLDIRFEDYDIIVISKQPGLVCHPAHGHSDGTLVNALIYHCGKDHLCNIQEDEMRLGIVHRLDADTSGLMICAKSNKAGEKLSLDMKNHTTSRHYFALVHGIIKQDTGKIEVPLLRTLNKRPKMIASNDSKAKEAITSFEVKERISSDYGEFTLLDCKIHTGRTHQIRAHMEYINHSVVGDPLYNSSAPNNFNAIEELNLNRQFLHSYKIGFNHPITGEYLKFEDTLPQDLQTVFDTIS